MTGIIDHPSWPVAPKKNNGPLEPPVNLTNFMFVLNESPEERAQRDIAEVCDEIKNLLLEKNRKYGNSALDPIRIFSKADGFEQIKVRMDDKLNRIKNAQSDEDEDVISDLLGYLVLYKVAKRQAERDAR